MLSHPTQPPLTRRLIANFLLCGTLVLTCLAAVSTIGPLADVVALGPLAIAASLAGLLATCAVLQRTVAPVCEIENQLRGLAEDGGEHELCPIPDSGPVSATWNRMRERVTSRQMLEKLESRLNDSLKGHGTQSTLQLLGSLPDGIAVTDQNNGITLANRAFRALLDLPADDDLTSRRVDELLPRGPGENGDAGVPAGIGAGQTSLEIRRGVELSDGVLRVLRLPLFEGDHESRQHVWLVRDVTQQKLADEMRTQFLQTATHELRTPLMNICAYAETLELTDDLDVERQKEFCNIINSEAMRLSRFVDELLDVNRMEAGALSLARHETDIERLLQDVIEKVRPQMTQKQIEFETKIPPKLPKLGIDKDKTAAALVNLLGNAAKYTPDGGRVKLTVEAGPLQMEFHVEDSGIGISEDELPKVFDRFFRSDDERVRDISGSGLGLAFSNEVVRLHGGRIDVHSELNRGTKFNLILPIR